MRVTSKTRKLLADIQKMCITRGACKTCPFWDKFLECRLNCPFEWAIADWEECKDDNAR